MPKGQGEWIRGRAASPFRTGLKIREYLLENGEMGIAEMHQRLKSEIRQANFTLAQMGKTKRYRSPHYQSFLIYVHALARAGLVEFAREEELELDQRTANLFQRGREGESLAPTKRFYRLTALGTNTSNFTIAGNSQI